MNRKEYISFNSDIRTILDGSLYDEQIGGKGNIFSKDGLLVVEPKTLVQSVGVTLQKYLPKGLTTMMTGAISDQKCASAEFMSRDPKKVKQFVDNYKLDYGTMEKCKDIADEPCPVDVTGKDCNINKETKCLTRFDSMNDLFVRVRTGLPAGEGERLTVASPADCFCTAFESETSAKKLWIKGREFTLKGMFFEDKIARSLMGRLMGKFGATDRTEDTPAVPESAGFDSSKLGVVIFRLAPSHYHRYHAPVSGRILSIRKLGSRYLSVQPTIVNDSGTNVYTENVRVIVTVQLDNGSKFYIAIIGATCVGSIVLTLSGLVSNAEVKEKLNINDRLGFSDKSLDDVNTKLNDVLRSTDIRMKQNEEMGYFQYGGSTIVCAYEHDKFEFTKLGVEIKVRSTYEDETEIVVGDTILKANTA